MADNTIEKTQYDQMKSWVQSIYNTTKGSTPNISDVTQSSIMLASQAQELQRLLTTAYTEYNPDGCTHNTTVDADNSSVKTSYTSIRDTDYESYNYSYDTDSGCSANNDHDSDK